MREWEIGAVENIHGALPYILFAPILALVGVGVNRIGKELSHYQRKPDPTVLLEICNTMNVSPSDTVYVGDSIAHAIMMANEAGVFSIWTAYGTERDPSDWDKLVRITHWTQEDVAREKQLREVAQDFKPNFVAENSLSEILQPLGLT